MDEMEGYGGVVNKIVSKHEGGEEDGRLTEKDRRREGRKG